MCPNTEHQLWPAPAKLNLFLHITGRRPDGYHELQTLFQLLDWGDELLITVTSNGQITRSCVTDDVPESEDICLHAAHLLQTHCGVHHGAHIELKKRIPVGAGLGGGSSDAATVLTALNALWSCGLSHQQLAELGLKLGADIPVFIHGHSAWAQGRGEQLLPARLGNRFYLLVFPAFGISTADVFAHPRLKRDSAKIKSIDEGISSSRNDCLAVVLEMYPQLREIMDDLRSWAEPCLSGTGSTFFLSFDTQNAAISAAGELKSRYNVRAVNGVDTSPLLDRLSAAG